MKTLTLPKQNRLCNKTHIEDLFQTNNSVFCHPVKAVFSIAESQGGARKGCVKVLISVSKRNHKHAVTRNLLKRRMREAYRINQGLLSCSDTDINIALIYSTSISEPYQKIENGVRKALIKIETIISQSADSTSAATNLDI